MYRFSNVLNKCYIFKGVDEKEILNIIEYSKKSIREYCKNEIVISMGSRLTDIYIVLTGNVTISRLSRDGNEVIVEKIGKGDIFGESYAFLEIENIPITVTSDSNATILALDCKRLFAKGLRNEGDVIRNIIINMANKLINLNTKLYILQKNTIRDKVLQYIEVKYSSKSNKEYELPFSKGEFAAYLGVNRSALSRELKKMQEEGLISMNGRVIKILT